MSDMLRRSTSALSEALDRHCYADAAGIMPLDKTQVAQAVLLAALDPEDDVLVEHVARSMCDDLGLHADDWMENLRGARIKTWQREADTARAAISAFRNLLSPADAKE